MPAERINRITLKSSRNRKAGKDRQPVQPVCFQQISFEQKGQQKTGGHDNDYEHEFGIFKSEQMLKRSQYTEKKGIQEECDSIFRRGKAGKRPPAPARALYK